MQRGLDLIITSFALGLIALITLTYLETSDARSQVTTQAIPRTASQNAPSATPFNGSGSSDQRRRLATATLGPVLTSTPPNIWDNYTFPTSTSIPTPSPITIHTTGAQDTTVPYLFILSQYDWPLQGAIATMMCESRGQTDAVSPAGAVGLFQIHPYATENFDPAINITNAYLKWLDGNRSFYMHWTRWGGCGAGW